MSSAATVRLANSADRDVIASFNTLMAKETENVELEEPVVQLGVAAVLADPSKGTYFVTEIGERVVAQLLITYEWSDWRNAQMWWIQSVYVHPEYRKQGLFKTLYAHVRAEAIKEGVCGLRLYVDNSNTRAMKSYAALGMISHYAVYEEEFD